MQNRLWTIARMFYLLGAVSLSNLALAVEVEKSPVQSTETSPEKSPEKSLGKSPEKSNGWFILKWMEKPSAHGPSKTAKPEDLAEFQQVGAFDHEMDDATFKRTLEQLHEGDVLAYRLGKWEARKEIFTGKLNKVAYRLYQYGHLAIVVHDPKDVNTLRIFSSESFKGPNLQEGLETLREHSFDVYRLNKWERVDKARLNEFVQLAIKKAGHWYGYDFSGMFGLWNSNLKPSKPEEIGHDYICSTIVLTALHYAGLALDSNESGGLLDIVTPAQVIKSKGHYIAPPDATIDFELAQKGECGKEAAQPC